MEPYYTLAEQLYQVHGARGEDPTEPPASAPLPLPRAAPRAADPAALRRPRRRGLPPVPRPVRGDARRGEHAVQHLRALRVLRRLPVPAARQVRRRGPGRAPRAGAPQRHAADRRHRSCAWTPTPPAARSPGSRSSATASARRTPPASSSCPAGPPTPPSCCSRRRTTGTRTGWPTAPTRSGATTCSTTARRCSRCRRSRTRRCSRRRSASTTSTSAPTTSTTRWATSRWSASRTPRCTAARSRSRPSWRPTFALRDIAEHAVDFWLSTEDLPRPDNRVTLAHGRQRPARYEETNHKASQELYHQLKSMLGHLGMHPDHLVPRHAYLKTAIPVAASPTRPARAGSAPTPRRRCSTPTAGPTRSTTSTWSTPASSRASAP